MLVGLALKGHPNPIHWFCRTSQKLTTDFYILSSASLWSKISSCPEKTEFEKLFFKFILMIHSFLEVMWLGGNNWLEEDCKMVVGYVSPPPSLGSSQDRQPSCLSRACPSRAEWSCLPVCVHPPWVLMLKLLFTAQEHRQRENESASLWFGYSPHKRGYLLPFSSSEYHC